ncbi:hypothetical protein ACSS6W_010898 [Trichoderma asperelloides]
MVRGKELSPQQRSQICELHSLGYGYRRIFKLLAEVPLSTIKYTCQQEAKRKENQSRPRSGAPRKLQVPSRGSRRRKDSSPVPVDDIITHNFTGLDATYQNVTYHDLLAMVDWSIFPTEQLHPIDGMGLVDDAAVAQIDAAVTQMDNSMTQIGDTAPRMNDITTQMDHQMHQLGDPVTHMDDSMPLMHDIAPHIQDITSHVNNVTPEINDMPPQINDTIPQINDIIPQINDIIPQIENTHINDTITQLNNMAADTDLDLVFQDPTYQDVSYHDLLALVDWSIMKENAENYGGINLHFATLPLAGLGMNRAMTPTAWNRLWSATALKGAS